MYRLSFSENVIVRALTAAVAAWFADRFWKRFVIAVDIARPGLGTIVVRDEAQDPPDVPSSEILTDPLGLFLDSSFVR